MPKIPATICVVDDDASVRRSPQRLLVANGFRVEAFADAQSYLERGPDVSTGCVILDGAVNKGIASDLGIADKTVKIHRSRVTKKLEVNFAAALLLACQQMAIESATKP